LIRLFGGPVVAHFDDSFYTVKTATEKNVRIDVTNSISSGLEANKAIREEIIPWMKERGLRRVLDFGAGALRHTIPFLEAGFEVICVEFPQAYTRPTAAKIREEWASHDGLTEIFSPKSFLKCRRRYDVALLLYVLQTIPDSSDRRTAMRQIASCFDRHGPRRLYYASRTLPPKELAEMDESKIISRCGRDGWVMGRGEKGRSFFTQWNSAGTDEMFLGEGFVRSDTCGGFEQGFVYDLNPGAL